MPRQVKAVLFDYGNVISQPQGRAEVAAMAAILNSPIDRFEGAYWADRAAFDRAAITPEAYWDATANRLSRTLTETEQKRLRSSIIGAGHIRTRSWRIGPRRSARPA